MQTEELVPILLANGNTFYVDAATADRHRRLEAVFADIEERRRQFDGEMHVALRVIGDTICGRIEALEQTVSEHTSDLAELKRTRK